MTTLFHVVLVVEATIAGVKQHVLSLTRGLDRTKFNITVACPPVRRESFGDTSFADELRALGIAAATIDMRPRLHPPTDAAAVWQLRRLFLWTGAHIVHAHSTKAGLLARPAARLAGVPVVIYSPHAFAFAGARNSAERGLIAGAERWLARWTDILLCVSEGERAQALRAGVAPPDKLAVIPNGVELARFQAVDRAEARRCLGIDPDTPVIGFVGRLETQKDVATLIEAVAELSRSRPALLVLIVGDGSLRSSLEQQTRRLGVTNQVRFLGYRPDVPALLPALDVFVLPSLYEGLPYTVLEAMAARVPVVATDVPGTRDVVRDGETGRLVPPRDPLALSAAVAELLGQPDLRGTLAAAGFQLVERAYRLQDSVRRIERLYQDALGAKGVVAPAFLPGEAS